VIRIKLGAIRAERNILTPANPSRGPARHHAREIGIQRNRLQRVQADRETGSFVDSYRRCRRVRV